MSRHAIDEPVLTPDTPGLMGFSQLRRRYPNACPSHTTLIKWSREGMPTLALACEKTTIEAVLYWARLKRIARASGRRHGRGRSVPRPRIAAALAREAVEQDLDREGFACS